MAEQDSANNEDELELLDERRLLLTRAAVAVAIVAAMLIGLSVWEHSRQEDDGATVSTPPVPASGIHSIGTASAPHVAASVPVVGASAPALLASAPTVAVSAPSATVQSAPATGASDVVEETRGVENLPQPGKIAKQQPHVAASAAPAPRTAASAPSVPAARPEVVPRNEAPPRLALQTETPPPGARPPAGKAFALQVGVFSSAANAEDLRAKLVLAGIPAHIETRVEIGPFMTRAEVNAAQAKLKALGVERGKLVLVKP